MAVGPIRRLEGVGASRHGCTQTGLQCGMRASCVRHCVREACALA